MRLTDIDLRKVDANGRYTYLNSDDFIESTRLSDETIMALRRLYRRNDIAPNRLLRVEERKQVSNVNSRVQPSNNVNYKVVREQKYNDSRYKIRKRPRIDWGKIVVVGGLVVCIVIGSKLYDKLNSEPKELPVYGPPSIEQMLDNQDDYLINKHASTLDVIEIKKMELEAEQKAQQELDERKQLIRDICNIYQVNYDVVYNRICELSDDFSNDDYLNGMLPIVTCKGANVIADTEEELLIYMIRKMKHVPEEMGIDVTNLYINNGYTSGDEYCEQIENVSRILGVDKCLMYAIVQSECGFNSELFNEFNNPAGMRLNGEWWHFDTKEEGFFELGMEILKYYRMIGKTPDQIDKTTLSQIRDIHAPLSDNNDYWLPNVIDRLQYAQLNEAELFGSELQSNRLSQ